MKLSYCLPLVLVWCFCIISCSAQNQDSVDIKIKRFDTSLLNYLENKKSEEALLSEYRPFLDIFGKEILNIGGVDSVGYFDRLKSYFSEPTLLSLYKDEQNKFVDVQPLEAELSVGFNLLLQEFSGLKKPELYMHVSGLSQNVVIDDDNLSISADKYLGIDYALYQSFFYDYQRQQMNPDRMVPDYFLGFLMANFPFQGNEDVLLDRIVYEGKLRYILSRLMPGRQIWEYVGYTKDQYLWCSNNQGRIWKSILSEQHLYTPNYLVTSQYINEAPHTAFLPQESPGRVGIWLGYQIIISYMKNHPNTSLAELMSLTDAQEVLKQAKYKP